MRTAFRLSLLLSLLVLAVPALAQTQPAAADDSLTNEVAALRKSLQTLNSRLQTITDQLFAPEKRNEDKAAEESIKKVVTNLDLLAHAEQRAEGLRKQLIELIEKETAYKIRMGQFDEDLRPENIERSMVGIGGTRTAEMRDTRRRGLENEKKGIENLLGVTTQSRMRLEEDIRQADMLVTRLRQRLFPLIEREIDKIPPQ